MQRKPVDYRGQHPHIVCRGLLDTVVAGGELGTAEDVAATDDDRDLDPLLLGLDGLLGDVDHLAHADAPFAGRGEALARQLEDQSMVSCFRHGSFGRFGGGTHKKAPVESTGACNDS